MKKKILNLTLCAALSAALIPVTSVQAEPDYSDTSYWSSRCAGSNITTEADYNACQAYTEYMASKTPDMQAQLDDINSQKADISANIQAYQGQLDTYQSQLDTLNASISDTQSQISDIESQIADTNTLIDQKQAAIDDAQATIDSMSVKIKQRMANGQKSLRINTVLEVLMGAKSFSDLIRMVAALSDISANEQEQNEELVNAMSQLKDDQDALNDAKDTLSAQEDSLTEKKSELESQQSEVLVEQYKVQVIKSAAEEQEATLEAQGNTVASNISSVQETMNSISSDLDSLQAQIFAPTPTPTPSQETSSESGSTDSSTPDSTTSTTTPTVSTGWARPVYGSYRSAGTWTYPGGGTHLGYDFAVSIGTNLYAAGTGVILNSVNGCGVGALGSTCGSQYGGSTGGGNQIYLLCVVGDSLYAVKYLHMSINTPIAKGTIVNAGDYVGQSGSSGNSSGGHCHIEVFYLGDGTNFANYAKTWNGDLAFGAGWAGDYDGYGRRCEAGYGAPCRIRPEEIWGY